MDLSLELIGRDSYLLCGGLNFTEIVGTRAEWLAVAEWLRRPDGEGVRFDQIAVRPWAKGGCHFSTPFALTPSDGVAVTRCESLVLAEHIAVTLRTESPFLTLGA